jgi:hypothetical protein
MIIKSHIQNLVLVDVLLEISLEISLPTFLAISFNSESEAPTLPLTCTLMTLPPFGPLILGEDNGVT